MLLNIVTNVICISNVLNLDYPIGDCIQIRKDGVYYHVSRNENMSFKNIYNNPDNDWKFHTLTTYGDTNWHKYSDIAI